MKRIISLLTLVCVFMVCTVFAAGDFKEMFHERARLLMIENSTQLRRLDRNVNNAGMSYYDSVRRAEGIDVKGRTVTVFDTERYIRYDEYTQMLMMKQKELFPEQMRHSWKSLSESRETTQNKMEIALRGLYAGLVNSFNNEKLQKARLDMAEDTFQAEQKRFNMGLIGEIGLQEAKNSLQQQKMAYVEAERNLENTTRSFNHYIGVEINNMYERVITTEAPLTERLKDLGHYLLQALENRAEINSLERRIRLKLLEKEILERNGVNVTYQDLHIDYENLLLDIESLEIQLEKAKLSVENDIRDAYIEVTSAAKDMEMMQKQVAIQEKRLADMQLMYELGMVSQNAVRNSELSLQGTRNSCEIAIFNFNTLVMRLESAAGTGPEFDS